MLNSKSAKMSSASHQPIWLWRSLNLDYLFWFGLFHIFFKILLVKIFIGPIRFYFDQLRKYKNICKKVKINIQYSTFKLRHKQNIKNLPLIPLEIKLTWVSKLTKWPPEERHWYSISCQDLGIEQGNLLRGMTSGRLRQDLWYKGLKSPFDNNLPTYIRFLSIGNFKNLQYKNFLQLWNHK